MGLEKPLGLKWRSSTLFILSTVAMSLFTDLFLYGLVVPLLPFILEERVQIPNRQIQSYTSGLLAAYAAASVAFSLPAGYLADHTSTRRMPFLLGLTALMAATLLFATGNSVVVFTVARVLQGISAAVVWTVGLALVYDTVGSAHLGRTIGSIFGIISTGELISPVLGGLLYKKAGYRGVFGLGFGLLILDFLMRIVLIEKKVAARYELVGETDSNLSQPSRHANEADGPTEEDPLLSKRATDDMYWMPFSPPRWIKNFPITYIFRDVRLLIAMLLCLIQSSLLASFDATIPTYAKETWGFDSLNSGLLFIPLILPYLLLGSLCGWAVDRYGTKPAATVGYAYMVPALTILRLPHTGSGSQIALYSSLLFFCGIGVCIIGSPSLVEASFVVEQYHKANPDFFGEQGPYAQLYALNSLVYSLGMTIGPLFSGILKDSVGYGNANLVLASICLATSVLSFIYVGGYPKILARKSRHRLGITE